MRYIWVVCGAMIRYETLREQVSEYIRQRVLLMEYKPGERIIEKELADELGVSRGPIRESLRQLEQEGLVEYRRNRGCIVHQLSTTDVEEIFLIRAYLEAASVRQCGGKIPAGTLRQLTRILDQMKELWDTDGNQRFIDLDQQFHAEIVSACKLQRLFKTWDSVSALNLALFLTETGDQVPLNIQYERHKKVYDILCEGDIQKSEQAIKEHYLKTSALYL